MTQDQSAGEGPHHAQRPMLAHHAALTIRNPYPESLEKAAPRPNRVGRLPGCPCGITGPSDPVLGSKPVDIEPGCPHHGMEITVTDVQPSGAPEVADGRAVPAAAGHPKRGDLLDVTLDTGERRHLVVVGDAEVAADGTVTFDMADPENVAAMKRLRAITSQFDSTLGPTGVAAGVEPHHAAARSRTAEEQAALSPVTGPGNAYVMGTDQDDTQ